MKKRNLTFFLCFYLFSLFIIGGCSKPPEQDIGEAVSNSEDFYKKSKGIDCVGAFDGETEKLRLIFEEQPTDERSSKLIKGMLKTIEKYTNNTDTWDYYNAKLELANKSTVKFEGIKEAGKKLIVRSK
ncbi:hypothetical protein [Neobacillus sp. PS3-40]|uniref:hypothetical protein n=1 Tax=Neobacillus sp. PS3-40 TaxID=3070679 RepID=UPI0027DFC43D|nr:hypothetical protein [Neobacillus sp. PS3-40]WML44556.1 hypothetical protein RCG20_01175 [Neobacillus sp. PS3-40]